MNYTELTTEQLQARRLELQQQIATLRTELTDVVSAYDAKIHENDLKDKIKDLSPEEIATLHKILTKSLPEAQTLVAGGIHSEEAVTTL